MKYQDTCKLKNTNNGIEVTAEILDFKPLKILTVTLNRSVKVSLNYLERTKIYVGTMAGVEFTSNGPNEVATYKGRTR
jgi:hypothetical protein